MDRKRVPLLEVKLTDDGEGHGGFAGYASVFNGVDAYGDTIVPGAYQNTIPDFLRDGSILWSHDSYIFPVAYPTIAREDDKGLWVEAAFHSDPDAQRARAIVAERLAAGKSMGLSIGYFPKRWELTEDTRRLLEIELIETSLVLTPADAAARVAVVKTARPIADLLADATAALDCAVREVKALAERRDAEHRALTDTHREALGGLLQQVEAAALLAPLLAPEPSALKGRDELLALRLNLARRRLARRGIVEQLA